jgi:CHAT domain-containing protein
MDRVVLRLPDGAVTLDFFLHPLYVPDRVDESGVVRKGGWTSSQLSVWVLCAGQSSVRRFDLGEAAAIEKAVRQLLSELTAFRGATIPADSSAVGVANREVLRLLWEPLAAVVQDAKKVFVSPDGFLGTLPFETLQLVDGSYLLEHHSFVYLESIASLIDLPSERPSNLDPSLLCVGDVDYRKRDELVSATAETDDRPVNLLARTDVRGSFLNRWPSLPKSGEESRAITEIHEEQFESSGRLFLSGDEATEERVKEEVSRHHMIHLATHGFFQPEGLPSMWRQVQSESGERRLEMFEEERRIVGLMPGLLSGLVFAGANRVPESGRDDGLLTAEEISLLDLSQVELVVLSACETALGKAESGEGMLGLRRTFRQSGARTVISSLWSVEDRSTSLLMQGFYERLWLRGQGTLEALRGAQLDMLKRNRIENDGDGLPSTWGAFVLDGDWR